VSQSRKNKIAAHYFVNEPVIERSMRDAIALGAFLTPASQGAPKNAPTKRWLQIVSRLVV